MTDLVCSIGVAWLWQTIDVRLTVFNGHGTFTAETRMTKNASEWNEREKKSQRKLRYEHCLWLRRLDPTTGYFICAFCILLIAWSLSNSIFRFSKVISVLKTFLRIFFFVFRFRVSLQFSVKFRFVCSTRSACVCFWNRVEAQTRSILGPKSLGHLRNLEAKQPIWLDGNDRGKVNWRSLVGLLNHRRLRHFSFLSVAVSTSNLVCSEHIFLTHSFLSFSFSHSR